MELILHEPKDAASALRFCKCAERAATMKAEGYVALHLPEIQVVSVLRPAGGNYFVDLVARECNCPDFEQYGSFCKHMMFAAQELDAEETARWEAICAEVDAQQDAEGERLDRMERYHYGPH